MFKKIQNSKIISLFITICIIQILFFPLLKYYNLNTFYADFGVFLNHTYNVLDEPRRIIQGHFQPILYFFGILNYFVSHSYIPYLLLIIQSTTIVFCAFLINKYFSKSSLVVFFLYIPTFVLALKDFHLDFIFLITFLIFFIFFHKGKFLEAIIIQNFFFLSKEFFVVYSILTSLFLIIFFYKNKNKKLFYYSILSFFFNLFFFIFIVVYLLPKHNNIESVVLNKVNGQYENTFQFIIYFLKNSFFKKILELLCDLNFLKFLFICILPILLLSFKEKKFWIFLLPNFLIILLFENKNFYNYYSHYSAPLIPLLIYLANQHKNISKYFFILLISTQFIFGTSMLSRLFWSKKVDEISIHNFLNFSESQIIKQTIKNHIPTNKDIIVITQNNINWHTLADRKVYRVFPEGLYENDDKEKYIILNTSIEPFLGDRGCNYIYTECIDKKLKEKYNEIILDLKQTSNLENEKNNLLIFSNNYK